MNPFPKFVTPFSKRPVSGAACSHVIRTGCLLSEDNEMRKSACYAMRQRRQAAGLDSVIGGPTASQRNGGDRPIIGTTCVNIKLQSCLTPLSLAQLIKTPDENHFCPITFDLVHKQWLLFIPLTPRIVRKVSVLLYVSTTLTRHLSIIIV